MKKTILSLILAVALCLALGCGVAMADDIQTVSVTYLDQNNTEQTVSATVVDTAYVTDEDNSGRTSCSFWNGFYYVNSDVNITEVDVAAGVNLILGPNADLDFSVNENSKGTLNIFAAKDRAGSCSIDNLSSTVITLYGGTYTNTVADKWQLGSGFCFRKNSSDSQTYSTGAQVVYCGHASWGSGKCARCGFACTHKDSGGSVTLNSTTGKCSVCGEQLHTVSVANTGGSYETFNKAYDAFKQIAGNINVKLLANAGFSGNYTQIDRKDVTLDLNGFTFKRAGDNASNATYIVNGSNVTIQDTSTDKTGQALDLVLSGTTDHPSSLTMKDGVYVNDIQVQQYSTLTVENASIGMNEATDPNTSDRLSVLKSTSKLVMNAGAVKHLSVGTDVTDVTLNGGSFGKIYRRNGDFGGLLGEGRAYQYTSGANQGQLVDLTALTGTDTLKNVEVVAHTEHTYSPSGSGTCLYCPQEHAHDSSSSINQETGRCTVCGKALYGAKYGSTLTETLEKAVEQAQAGDTVTVLDDTALPNGFTIGKTLTLELNGKKLTGDLTAQGEADFTLTIQDSAAKSENQYTGSITGSVEVGSNATVVVTSGNIGELTNTSGTVKVTDGDIGTLSVQRTDGAGTTLSGGSYKEVAIRKDGNYSFYDLLENGKAFQKDGSLYKPEGKTVGQAGYTQLLVIEDVTLGTCSAHRCDVSSSHCDYCYTGLVAKVNYNGTDTYYTRFDSVESNVLSTSVITLLADVPPDDVGSFWYITGTLTLDLNGHTFAGNIEVGDTAGDFDYSGYFTLQDTGAAAGTFTGELRATLGTLTITGGQVSTLKYADECAVTLSGGSFGCIKRYYGYTTATPADLLKAGFAYRSTEGDKALVELDGVSSTLNNVAVVTCPHGKANGTHLCAYCHAEAVATVTHEGAVTDHFALTDAVRAAQAGDTVTLIKGCDSLTIESGAAFTLDLNGKTISSLTVKTTPIFLADSAGGGTITTLSLDGVTAGQLLNTGWGLSTAQGGANTWHDKTSTATSLSGAKVAKLPIQSVSLQATARDSDIPQTSYAFGDYHVLTATVTQPEGKSETVSYAWYQVVGETESSVSTNYLTFAPNTPMVGTYLYRVKVTVDGYQTSADLSIEITKATIPAGSYTAPVALENLAYLVGTPQTLILAGRAPYYTTMKYRLGTEGDWSTTLPQAENAGTHTVSWMIDGGDNYFDLTSTTPVSVSIARKTLNSDNLSFFSLPPAFPYTGSAIEPAFTLKDGETEVPAGEYTFSYSDNVNAGPGTVSVTATPGGNYAMDFTAPFSITPVDPETPNGLRGVQGRALSTVSLPQGWSWDAPETVMDALGTKTFPASYTHVNGNYNDVTSLALTVTVSEKEYKLLTVTMNGWTYGQTAKAPVFTMPNGTTATILYSHGGAHPTQTVPTNAGSYTVTVRYETTTEIWTGEASFTIAQAKLNTPTFDRVSEAGKTLAEVGWDVDAFATLTWDDGDSTEILRGQSYGWTLTPTGENADNYMVLTGSFIPWPNPSSGSSGSSGGSGSSNTVKHEDGSVTTTVTDKNTGNVTETTKSPSGVTGTTVTDSEGNATEISATVPASAVESGETASLPIGAVDSTAGTTLSVDVPTGGARVEIPVENPTAGTVVVVVHADGTQTVLADSKLSENGVTVTLVEDCTLKIVENAKDFDDVTEGSYYAEAVAWASAREITGGTSTNTFSPDLDCGRGQLVTFLWRAAGQPVGEGEHGFDDVENDAYYTQATAWAVENGIVNGYGNGTFGANDPITREQAAVMLYRFAQARGMDTTQSGKTAEEFADFASISDYARTAMEWAVNAGILQGYDNTLMPQAQCDRGQITTMLYRLLGQ